jgi:hypothetical protein
LHQGAGQLDRERSRELLGQFLPPAPASVLDIGGGPGGHTLCLRQNEASRPFDPSRDYDKLDMSRSWPQCSPEIRQWWIGAATEVIQEFTSETL